MNLLFALALAFTARADDIFNLQIDILVNVCSAKGVCKAERIGPLQHSIVLRNESGQFEWFDRIDEGFYASVRVIRSNDQYRVQAYVANGDEAGSSAQVSAWVAQPAALNKLRIGPTPQKRNGVVNDISLTLN